MMDATSLPDDFDGRVRLFPLPGLVLFPHAMQPLHLFEPRYVEMLHESLASDQLIAMATIVDTYDLSFGPPPISSTVCIGKIVSHSELQDDRHNILLVGARRATIRQELDLDRSFRIAQTEVIEDQYTPVSTGRRERLKRQLLDAFGRIIPQSSETQSNLHALMASQMTIGPITDIIAYTLPFETDDKLRLLGIGNVDDRAGELIELLNSGAVDLGSLSLQTQSMEIDDLSTLVADDSRASSRTFPPDFSLN